MLAAQPRKPVANSARSTLCCFPYDTYNVRDFNVSTGGIMTNRRISFIVKHQNPLMLRPTDTVQNACQQMCERRVGATLVTDADGHLKGIFTGRDATEIIAKGGNAHEITLAEAMTADPDSIASERNAIEALRMMSDGGYRHLPVVVGGRVVGIVSRGDFKGLELDRFEDEVTLWERIC
jgi:CBS domain-containing protein